MDCVKSAFSTEHFCHSKEYCYIQNDRRHLFGNLRIPPRVSQKNGEKCHDAKRERIVEMG